MNATGRPHWFSVAETQTSDVSHSATNRWLSSVDWSVALSSSFFSRSKAGKGSSYIAQYPILRTVQSALHFTSLTDLFTQTPSRLLWEASSHMLQLMREGCSYTYPPLSIARYSFNSAE